MFDVLTYEKGAAVLRMLEQYLGAEVFRDGVRAYLHEHAYANAETGDLWDALGRAASQPMPAVMDAWIFQPGYPLVSARLDGNELVLTQQRFTLFAGAPARLTPCRQSAVADPGAGPLQRRADAHRRSGVLLAGGEAASRLPPARMRCWSTRAATASTASATSGELLERLLGRLPGSAASSASTSSTTPGRSRWRASWR